MTCEPWPVRWPCDITSEDPDLIALVVDAAQTYLWSLSGRRYGLCTTTEYYRMPCTGGCAYPFGYDFGPGVEWRLGLRPRDCCRISLSQTPVRAIVAVTLDGDLVDPDEYLLERDTLARIGQCWPCEQDCDPPGIAVTYSYGIDVPALGQLAMGELACELLAAVDGADCRIPSNAISVTRQGVTVDLGDAETLYRMGRIGLPICDAFLRDTNPGRLLTRSTVHSPDMARRLR